MSGTSNRITIQLDLSGYSFKIQDRNEQTLSQEYHSCPVDLSVERINALQNAPFLSADIAVSTWKYTMVPLYGFDKSKARETLSELKELDVNETVLHLEMPQRKAVMLYAIPSDIYSGLMPVAKNTRIYPVAYSLIERLAEIEQNNRVAVTFSDGMLHIAVAERDRLMFVNTFPARDIATMEYFIMSIIKEMPFNPEHTYIYIYGKVDSDTVSELEKYFPKVINVL